MERTHGSLIRGALRERSAGDAGAAQASGARYSLFVTPRDGLSSLVAAIAARLPAGAVRLNTAVSRLERRDSGLASDVGDDDDRPQNGSLGIRRRRAGDCPLPAAARLLDRHRRPACRRIWRRFRMPARRSFRWPIDRRQIAHPLDGFGFVVPAIEGRRILSASFSSQKFPGRAPADQVLLRIFIGGACQAGISRARAMRNCSKWRRKKSPNCSGPAAQPIARDDRPLAAVDAPISFGPLGPRCTNRISRGGNPGLGAGRQCLSRRRHSAGRSQSGEAAAERIVARRSGFRSLRKRAEPPSAIGTRSGGNRTDNRYAQPLQAGLARRFRGRLCSRLRLCRQLGSTLRRREQRRLLRPLPLLPSSSFSSSPSA